MKTACGNVAAPVVVSRQHARVVRCGIALCVLIGSGALGRGAAAQAPVSGNVPDASEPTPVQIIAAMEKVYATCKSYRDTGEVSSVSRTDGGQFGSQQPFSTAFVRPGRFRFEFTDRGLGDRSSRFLIWLEEGNVLSWWDAKPGLRQAETLQQALGAASGLSGDTSIRVPGLLMPREVGRGSRLIAPERLPDAEAQGATCWRISGKGRPTPYSLSIGGRAVTVQDETVTFWIDRERFLLLKVEEKRSFDTYRSVRTTTYSPQLNVEIPDLDLTFTPPAAP